MRVGVVDDITPIQQPDGKSIALLDLKLDTTVKPLPTDTTLIVRPRSALGLKYVELTKGTSQHVVRGGQHDPAPQRHAGTGRDRRVLQHVRRAHAAGHPRQPEGLRQRFRRTRQPTSTSAIKELVPLTQLATKVLSNVAAPSNALRPLLRLAGPHRRDRRPGRRDPGGAVRQPRHDLHRLGERRAAVPAGDDREGARRGCRSRPTPSRRSARCSSTRSCSSRRCGPAQRRSTHRCRRSPTEPRSASRRWPAHRTSTACWASSSPPCRRSPRTPMSRSASATCSTRSRSSTRRSRR